jgi:molybdopterin converting factor small subunit
MVRVEVRLFANLREAAEKESLFIDFANVPTVEDALKELLRCNSGLKKILLFNGVFNEHYKVLVGSDIVFPENFSNVLVGSRIAILPPVSGG